jgi:copper resistance protein D
VTPVLAGLVHGLGLAALATVIGALVLEQMILPLPELAIARDRLRRWTTGCLVVLIPLTVVELVIRTQAMSRAPLAAAIASLPEIVGRTHLGAILTARAGVLVLAALLSLTSVTALRALCLLTALGVALTISLTGHAAAWGDVTPSVAVDWAHAVAALAWTGGLLGLALAVLPRHAALPPPVVAVVGCRFSRLAGFCLLTVVVTGIYNAWSQLGVVSRLWTTPYGRVLLVKVAVVVALVWLGAVNRYVVVPRLGDRRVRGGFGTRLFRISRLVIRGPRRGARAAAAPARLSTYVTLEALIALAVFTCTGALGEVTPGRHTAFERKPSSHVTNVTPSPGGGGARVSGTVSPPPGNAARGRSVFAKLRCFACHPVRGEHFPAPSRPGPDLTEVGRYHPGYLVESIMNPNARIVDGPGYTDSHGLSTMPDYREKLTVSELIDLVAYLKGRDGGPEPARN